MSTQADNIAARLAAAEEERDRAETRVWAKVWALLDEFAISGSGCPDVRLADHIRAGHAALRAAESALATEREARQKAERERDRAAQIATKEAVIASSALSRATAAESRAGKAERERDAFMLQAQQRGEAYDLSAAAHLAAESALAAEREAHDGTKKRLENMEHALRWLRGDIPYRAPESLGGVAMRVYIPIIDKALAPQGDRP